MITIEAPGLDVWLAKLGAAPLMLQWEVADELNEVLTDMFRMTQRDVHVITGRLRDSGRMEKFEVGGRGGFMEGAILYDDLVVRGEWVYWGQFELARGGPHDFMTPAQVEFEDDFMDALRTGFNNYFRSI